MAEQIEVTGAGLCSLAAPGADTTSPAGRMVLIVFSGSTTFEHCPMLSRASAATQRLDEEGTSARETAKLLQVHAATLYRGYDVRCCPKRLNTGRPGPVRRRSLWPSPEGPNRCP